MAEQCPHCGFSLPATGDAFCPECYRALDEPTAAQRAVARLTGAEQPVTARMKAGRIGLGVGLGLGVLLSLAYLAGGVAGNPGSGAGAITGYVLSGSVIGWVLGDTIGRFL